MWKNIIKSMCSICKKKPPNYRQYDDTINEHARFMGYDPKKLCEECKEDLYQDQIDAWHGKYDTDVWND